MKEKTDSHVKKAFFLPAVQNLVTALVVVNCLFICNKGCPPLSDYCGGAYIKWFFMDSGDISLFRVFLSVGASLFWVFASVCAASSRYCRMFPENMRQGWHKTCFMLVSALLFSIPVMTYKMGGYELGEYSFKDRKMNPLRITTHMTGIVGLLADTEIRPRRWYD